MMLLINSAPFVLFLELWFREFVDGPAADTRDFGAHSPAPLMTSQP
jgi:hypothetical protein